MRERTERESGQSANTQQSTDKDDPKKDDKQATKQRKYGGFVRPVSHQAQVAFFRSGVSLPEEVLERVCEFRIDETRHFTMQLRSTVRLSTEDGGAVWSEFVRGRLTTQGADRLEGLRSPEGAPIGRLARPERGARPKQRRSAPVEGA